MRLPPQHRADGADVFFPGLGSFRQFRAPVVGEGVDFAGGAARLDLPFAGDVPLVLQCPQGRVQDALAGREGIGAAALDVYEPEPLAADSKLLGLDNLVTTPHVAAASADTFAPTVLRMYANIERVSRGEPIPPGDLVA